MKASKIILIVLALLIAFGRYAVAQRPMGPPSQVISKGHCLKDPSIIFTEEQTEKFENLKAAYSAEIKPLLSDLRNLRMELHYPISDSQASVKSEVLLDKQRKVSAIQAKLENLSFSYRVQARALFTKEELERFPADCPLKIERGFGIGKRTGGWGFRKGTRR